MKVGPPRTRPAEADQVTVGPIPTLARQLYRSTSLAQCAEPTSLLRLFCLHPEPRPVARMWQDTGVARLRAQRATLSSAGPAWHGPRTSLARGRAPTLKHDNTRWDANRAGRRFERAHRARIDAIARIRPLRSADAYLLKTHSSHFEWTTSSTSVAQRRPARHGTLPPTGGDAKSLLTQGKSWSAISQETAYSRAMRSKRPTQRRLRVFGGHAGVTAGSRCCSGAISTTSAASALDRDQLDTLGGSGGDIPLGPRTSSALSDRRVPPGAPPTRCPFALLSCSRTVYSMRVCPVRESLGNVASMCLDTSLLTVFFSNPRNCGELR